MGLQLGAARIGLGVAQGALDLILDILKSSAFKDLQDTLYRASEVVRTVQEEVNRAINQARDQLNGAKKILEALELTVKGDFEGAKRKAKEAVIQAQELYDNYQVQQKLGKEKLRLQLDALKNSTLSVAVTTAEGALELAKNNDLAFRTAQAGLDFVKDLEGTIYETLSGLIKVAAVLCDIRVVKLNGTITADAKYQKAFTIHMEGTLVGQDFKFDTEYTPGQTSEFLERLAKQAFKHLGIA